MTFALVVSLCAPFRAVAQSDAADVEELIERERVRAALERAYDLLTADLADRAASADALDEATDIVLEIGAPAVEFMVPELDGLDPRRVLFTIYALGHLGGAEAEQPLRELVASSNRRGAERDDRFNRRRKGLACLALGMMGHADAVDLLESGVVRSSVVGLYAEMNFLEATAIVTAPACLPRLQAIFERYSRDESKAERRAPVLRALAHVADASMRPFFLGLVDDDDIAVREVALETLGKLGNDEAARRVIVAALSDPIENVRKAAADGLEALAPRPLPDAALARLQVEDNPRVRGVLYRLLVHTRGEAAIKTLLGHWGRPDGLDRMRLIEAVGLGRLPNGINLIRDGLRDPDTRVGLRAVRALVDLGTPVAVEVMLEATQLPDWPVRLAAFEALSDIGETRAAPRATALLLGRLSSVDEAVVRRPRVRSLGQVVERFGHTERLEELRAAAESEGDPELKRWLTGLVERLALVARFSDNRERWIELAGSAERELRMLAYSRLADLGDPASIRGLVTAFDAAPDDEDRAAILSRLARAASPLGSDLVERVLVDPAFDPLTRREVRDQASWAARRIGGNRMIAALRDSAIRRHGRDYKVLVYLALLAGDEALDTLLAVRQDRVTYSKWDRGPEQWRLEWMIVRLRRGQTLQRLDVPPAQLRFGG